MLRSFDKETSISDVLFRLTWLSKIHTRCAQQLNEEFCCVNQNNPNIKAQKPEADVHDPPFLLLFDVSCSLQWRRLFLSFISFDIHWHHYAHAYLCQAAVSDLKEISHSKVYKRMTWCSDNIKVCEDMLGSNGFHG